MLRLRLSKVVLFPFFQYYHFTQSITFSPVNHNISAKSILMLFWRYSEVWLVYWSQCYVLYANCCTKQTYLYKLKNRVSKYLLYCRHGRGTYCLLVVYCQGLLACRVVWDGPVYSLCWTEDPRAGSILAGFADDAYFSNVLFYS